MRRFLIAILCLAIMLCSFPAYALESEGEINGCHWTFEKGVLTFDGTGVIPLVLYPNASWEEQQKFYKSVKQIVIGSEISGLESWDAFTQYQSVTRIVFGVDYLDGIFTMADKIKEVVYTSEHPYVLGWNFCFSRLDKIVFENPDAGYVQEDNFLFNQDKSELFYYLGSKSENVKIPEGVKIIRSGAFACSKIKSVEFPSTLEIIECDAFIRCNNLKKVVIPASCKAIGHGALLSCDKLQKIEFLGNEINLVALYGNVEDLDTIPQGDNFAGNRS